MYRHKMQHQPAFILVLLVVLFTKSISEKSVNKDGDGIGDLPGSSLADSSSSCGGKLHSADGAISYKNFSPYAPNERCAWAVRVANATCYNVFLETLGVSGTLIISGFGLVGHVTHNIPSGASNISVPNANALVITFATASDNNTESYRGFSLRYSSSIFEDNHKASASSEDILVPANQGHIKYPSNASTYGNFDLSMIVITPLLGVQYPVGGRTEVVYIRSGLEGQSCQDKLSVYAFQRPSSYESRHWVLLGRLCGGVDSEFISSQDLIMVVFESDFSGVSSGFHLYTRYVY